MIVAQEQLLKVRRGVGGGYMATRPEASAVTHMAAIFLQTKGTKLREILRAIEPIRIELVRSAAVHADKAARTEIEAFLRVEEARAIVGYSYRYFLWAERRYAELLSWASGSTVLTLFLEILLDLISVLPPEEDVLVGRVERVAEASMHRGRVLRAVLEGDVETAVSEARQSAARSTEWLDLDTAASPRRPRGATSKRSA
jgi:DNA-binding FadR family transcriptional regulator